MVRGGKRRRRRNDLATRAPEGRLAHSARPGSPSFAGECSELDGLKIGACGGARGIKGCAGAYSTAPHAHNAAAHPAIRNFAGSICIGLPLSRCSAVNICAAPRPCFDCQRLSFQPRGVNAGTSYQRGLVFTEGQRAMGDTCIKTFPPKAPRCLGCARPMQLVRRTLRFSGLPDLYAFQCRDVASRTSKKATQS